ncbi:uncharacterized protein LOC105421304 isoform X1 [Amborella trichopoda]|uniref:uncharacterized protein LOC105421304 isoform X1 n=1 Tax=Amborella trichopoda TaxID=13333 RepID=UPI0009C16A08|nr:uncharacterized protein LOC105421304 isoform X1 [Amborella trichopoda]|eukprot:XP_020528359.1 uncharacterized protein LOC105421304 isoform X1 [Amborella trichopoda]
MAGTGSRVMDHVTFIFFTISRAIDERLQRADLNWTTITVSQDVMEASHQIISKGWRSTLIRMCGIWTLHISYGVAYRHVSARRHVSIGVDTSPLFDLHLKCKCWACGSGMTKTQHRLLKVGQRMVKQWLYKYHVTKQLFIIVVCLDTKILCMTTRANAISIIASFRVILTSFVAMLDPSMRIELNFIGKEKSWITVQYRQKGSGETGFSFVGGHITGHGMVYLGRPWGELSTVVFSNAQIDQLVIPQGGWDGFWSAEDRSKRFGVNADS